MEQTVRVASERNDGGHLPHSTRPATAHSRAATAYTDRTMRHDDDHAIVSASLKKLSEEGGTPEARSYFRHLHELDETLTHDLAILTAGRAGAAFIRKMAPEAASAADAQPKQNWDWGSPGLRLLASFDQEAAARLYVPPHSE